MRPDTVQHQREGDRQISTTNFNLMVDGVNRANRLYFDPEFFETHETGASTLVSLVKQPTRYHFQAISLQDPKYLGIRCGFIYRKGTKALSPKTYPTAGFSDDFYQYMEIDVSGYSVGSDWYVFAKFKDNASPYYCPELIPDASLEYTILPSFPTFIDNYVNRMYPICKFQTKNKEGGGSRILKASTLVQLWYGGNITDDGVVPDANSTSTGGAAPGPGRYTLQLNNEATKRHYLELQLYDVNTVPVDTKTMCYFDSGTTLTETVVTGSLKWAVMDSHNTKTTAPYRSLQIDSGSSTFQVYNFRGAVPITVGSSSSLDSTLAVLARKVSGGVTYIEYLDLSSCTFPTDYSGVCDYIEANCDWFGEWDTIRHTDLVWSGSTAGQAGQNDDHDARYWVKGAGVTTDNLTSNYGTAIGNAVNAPVIDLTGYALVRGTVAASYVRVTWGAGVGALYESAGTKVRYDWQSGILKDDAVTPATAIDHLNRKLEGSFDTTRGWRVTSALGSTDVTSGGLVVTGGAGIGGTLSATQVQIKTGALSYWNDTDFVHEVSGVVKIAAFGGDGRVHILSTERLMLDWDELWINNVEWEPCLVSELLDGHTVLRLKP